MSAAGVLSLDEQQCPILISQELREASASSRSYETIELSLFAFTTSSCALVLDVIQSSKHDLKELKLIENSLMETSTIITAAMAAAESLQTLSVSFAYNPPSDQAIEAIAHSIGCGLAARNCTLKNLILEGNPRNLFSVTDAAAVSLEAGMMRNSSLESLHIENCRFGSSDAVRAIARGMSNFATLKTVRLKNSGGLKYSLTVDDSCIAWLIRGLENHPQLEQLDISENKCLSEGLSALAALMDNTRLSNIDLSHQDIGENESMDLSPLVGALGRTSTLMSLELKYNKLSSDHAMACLAAAMMHNTSVKYLGLAGNKISNTGIEILASRVGSWKVLEKLDLSQNAFGEKGAIKLAKAMEDNFSIISVKCDRKLPSFKLIRCFADLNRSGRKYANVFGRIRPSIWPVVLSRTAALRENLESCEANERQAASLFFLVHHVPALVIFQSRRKKVGRSKKETNSARHRLKSIYHDAETIKRMHSQKFPEPLRRFPLVSNERCGSWYLNKSVPSCYFKSTDGHVNVWDFSLKRLNLAFLYNVICKSGGCVVVDSSVRKLLPDSFSRTLPIWAAVMNRITMRYARDLDEDFGIQHSSWNCDLCTPAGIVSEEEHEKMVERIESHVEALYRSQAIVDPKRLVRELVKPIRVAWMNFEGARYKANGETGYSFAEDLFSDEQFVVVCWNPSQYKVCEQDVDSRGNETWVSMVAPKVTTKNHVRWIDEASFYYTPGAADDQDSWASHLTPKLFWQHCDALLDASNTDDQVDTLIQNLVKGENDKVAEGTQLTSGVSEFCDRIGDSNLFLGSRRAGRPPECWEQFDAVLNVTNTSYPGHKNQRDGKYYLQLPVEEGKRDKTLLEKYMPLGLVFLIRHLQEGRRVLVHCAQGRDRSVAMVLVFVCLACPLTFPLTLKSNFNSWDLGGLEMGVASEANLETGSDDDAKYMNSGLSSRCALRLLEDDGGQLFLRWIHDQLKMDVSKGPLADKESIRIALHLIRQDREVAEPARATMQKINRFFMSNPLYRVSMTQK